MGTPEEDIFVDPSERDDLPDVLDDFGLEFNAGSDEWCVPGITMFLVVVYY
jgi:ubiquitin-like domain-containing CTD phosphatase 1